MVLRHPLVPTTSLDPASLDAQAVLDALCNWRSIETQIDRAVQRRRIGGDDTSCDEAVLMRAMRHPRPYYRLRAAELGAGYGGVAALALRDRYVRVRVLGAASRAAPPECLAVASRDRAPTVRAAVAANARTPLPAVLDLVNDRNADVRRAAARRSRLPLTVLHAFAHHTDDTMRCIAAGHRITVDLLEFLAEDASYDVTLSVAFNPDAPAHVLRRLAERRTDRQHGRAIASHPNTPVDVLDRLADVTDLNIWTLLVSNRSTCSATLDRVPRGLHPQSHRLLGRHPNASRDLLRGIAAPYLDSPDITLRGVGLTLLFRGPVRVLPAGCGHLPSQPPTFERPVDVMSWLADGGDVTVTATYAENASTPTWLRWFLHSQMKVSA